MEKNWSCLEMFEFIISVTLKKMKMSQASINFLSQVAFTSCVGNLCPSRELTFQEIRENS
jgi:hypothetical protein